MTKDIEELCNVIQSIIQPQFDDIKISLNKVDEKADKICTLASDVKVVNTKIEHLTLAQDELNQHCDNIDEKVNRMHDEPYDNFKKSKNQIMTTVVGRLLGDLGSAVGGALIALIASGKIHL